MREDEEQTLDPEKVTSFFFLFLYLLLLSHVPNFPLPLLVVAQLLYLSFTQITTTKKAQRKKNGNSFSFQYKFNLRFNPMGAGCSKLSLCWWPSNFKSNLHGSSDLRQLVSLLVDISRHFLEKIVLKFLYLFQNFISVCKRQRMRRKRYLLDSASTAWTN